MIEIFGWRFEGPFPVGLEMVNRAAVYVILRADNSVVDVGQSGETGVRLLNHDRKQCWDMNGGKFFAVRWMPTDVYSRKERLRFENGIRESLQPVCGIK